MRNRGWMMNPGYVLGWFLPAWLSAVMILIVYRILTGRISLRGLLTTDGDRFSPERLQLLLITFATLAAYLENAVSINAMATLPNELVVVLAGSHALYLGGKIAGR
jgi:hypothetical protein